MRVSLSPAYTGAKMREMFELINTAAINYVNYYKTILETKEIQSIEIESKDSFMRFANDVIATCALGIECDSLQNPTNEMYKMALASRPVGFVRTLKFLIALNIPKLSKVILIVFIITNFQYILILVH